MANPYRTLKFKTTENLAANETLNSEPIKTEQYNHMRGRVVSNQTGIINHQQSDDGITWDTLYSQEVAVSTPVKYDEICYCKYYRIQYVNGETATTYFRLSVYADPYSS